MSTSTTVDLQPLVQNLCVQSCSKLDYIPYQRERVSHALVPMPVCLCLCVWRAAGQPDGCFFYSTIPTEPVPGLSHTPSTGAQPVRMGHSPFATQPIALQTLFKWAPPGESAPPLELYFFLPYYAFPRNSLLPKIVGFPLLMSAASIWCSMFHSMLHVNLPSCRNPKVLSLEKIMKLWTIQNELASSSQLLCCLHV